MQQIDPNRHDDLAETACRRRPLPCISVLTETKPHPDTSNLSVEATGQAINMVAVMTEAILVVGFAAAIAVHIVRQALQRLRQGDDRFAASFPYAREFWWKAAQAA